MFRMIQAYSMGEMEDYEGGIFFDEKALGTTYIIPENIETFNLISPQFPNVTVISHVSGNVTYAAGTPAELAELLYGTKGYN